HGAGGEESRKMIAEMILPRFGNPYLDPLGDSAVIDLDSGTRIAFTTDSYTIDPIFFPDSDIGFLAVCGTVNDLAMSGAVPMFISAGLIIEEGFSVKDLDRVLDSMAEAACVAGVRLVTGDTKVVARGAADKIFINTAGLGVIPERIDIAPENCRAGDSVIVSGPVGSHGMAVVVARENFGLESSLKSDVAPVGGQVKVLLDACPGVRMMRDPTRGGLAGVLNEIAERIGLGVELEEKSIPVLDAVRQGCEILGFEPLFLANEGVFVTVLPVGDTERALSVLRENGAPEAALIGSLVEDELKTVTLNTLVGGRRVVIPMGGELLPRIC
ncbi:MAG: hydrogenase expression/formation protein HypE, partial [Gemmatimonadota bacterium]|nr:hydrogenase expression/formation protein HypE [Gemmatimonadota bacterium]